MYKLLTEQEKSKVGREYLLRRIGIILSLLSVIGILSFGATLPALILAQSQEQEAIVSLAYSERATAQSDKNALEAWAKSTRQKIVSLSLATPSDQTYEYVRQILSMKSSAISINGYSFNKTPQGVISLKIGGKAKDRQSLLDFQQKLRSSGNFSRADFPVSVLAKDSDLDFEISLTPTTK